MSYCVQRIVLKILYTRKLMLGEKVLLNVLLQSRVSHSVCMASELGTFEHSFECDPK